MFRRQRGGFILAAAIAICFAMVVISLIVANQQRSMVGFARNTHAEAQQSEAALSGFAQMRGWLAGQMASTQLFSSSNPLAPGSNSGSVDSPDGVKMVHRIMFRPPGNLTEPHSYAGPAVAPGLSGLTIPPAHTSVLFENTVKADEKAGTSKFIGLFSSNFPFALMSESNAVLCNSVRSVSNVTAANITPLMAHVYGRTGVNVTGRLNGRAYSTGGVATGSGGIPYPQYPTQFRLPADFVAAANDFKNNKIPGGATSTRLQDVMRALNDAQHRDFTAADVAQTAVHNIGNGVPTPPLTSSLGGQSAVQSVVTSSSVGETTFDGSTLEVKSAVLRLPPNAHERLNVSSVKLDQGLFLEEGAVLHVQGSVYAPVIRLARRATLSVTGEIQTSRVALTYSPGEEPITSSLVAGGSIALGAGMTQQQLLGPALPMTPMASSFPYPSQQTVVFTTPTEPPALVPETEESTGLKTAFTTQAATDIAALIAGGLPDYLVTLNVGTSDDTSVPGVFVSGNSIQAGPGPRVSGLLHANTINVDTPLVGAAWSTGQLTARNVFFFPYFTHAFGYFGGATPMNISATDYHPIGFGKVP